MATNSSCNNLSWQKSFSFAFGILILGINIGVGKAQLNTLFYESTCPGLGDIVRSGVYEAIEREPRMGASLLRLHYIDCIVNGCDASILLDDTDTFTGEKGADQIVNSLRGFDVIDSIKAKVESACPGVVSCADILALAARASVVLLDGPSWMVELGRRDSITASLSRANSEIPAPTMNLTDMISFFGFKGISQREMVALLGGHTIGYARCATFRDRLYNETSNDNNFSNRNWVDVIKQKCPQTGGGDQLSPLDVGTPLTFNSGYFLNLLLRRGLLHSDQQLFNGSDPNVLTSAQVSLYIADKDVFFLEFGRAMTRMSNFLVLTDERDGQIRTNCRTINPTTTP